MEDVRKGRGLKDSQIELMKSNNVPDWYIWSCNTIKYMFPKAHAAAYVVMSFRIAWFKVHQPLAFYSAYFSTKVEDFDAQIICMGKEAVRMKINELRSADEISNKEEGLLIVLEVADEMYSRGFEFSKVDLYKSESMKFMVVDGKVMPPLRALNGVGESAALSIREAALDKEFLSIDDIKTSGKASKTVIEALRAHGCLRGLPETDQLDFLSMVGF